MNMLGSVWLLIAVAILAANLPWLSERFGFVYAPGGGKREWMRLVEWLAMYGLVALIAMGLERKSQGQLHAQEWEFYVATLCLFTIFALPGFLYRHVLSRLLARR